MCSLRLFYWVLRQGRRIGGGGDFKGGCAPPHFQNVTKRIF
jgi:hypothetical protein